jgi:hypothetical protein
MGEPAMPSFLSYLMGLFDGLRIRFDLWPFRSWM